MTLGRDEREVIGTIADDESAWHVFSDSARFTRRLLALAARWGVTPERSGEGYKFTLPLAAIRFATPRRLSERQREALQRGRGRSQEGHFASKGPG